MSNDLDNAALRRLMRAHDHEWGPLDLWRAAATGMLFPMVYLYEDARIIAMYDTAVDIALDAAKQRRQRRTVSLQDMMGRWLDKHAPHVAGMETVSGDDAILCALSEIVLYNLMGYLSHCSDHDEVAQLLKESLPDLLLGLRGGAA